MISIFVVTLHLNKVLEDGFARLFDLLPDLLVFEIVLALVKLLYERVFFVDPQMLMVSYLFEYVIILLSDATALQIDVLFKELYIFHPRENSALELE